MPYLVASSVTMQQCEKRFDPANAITQCRGLVLRIGKKIMSFTTIGGYYLSAVPAPFPMAGVVTTASEGETPLDTTLINRVRNLIAIFGACRGGALVGLATSLFFLSLDLTPGSAGLPRARPGNPTSSGHPLRGRLGNARGALVLAPALAGRKSVSESDMDGCARRSFRRILSALGKGCTSDHGVCGLRKALVALVSSICCLRYVRNDRGLSVPSRLRGGVI